MERFLQSLLTLFQIFNSLVVSGVFLVAPSSFQEARTFGNIHRVRIKLHKKKICQTASINFSKDAIQIFKLGKSY